MIIIKRGKYFVGINTAITRDNKIYNTKSIIGLTGISYNNLKAEMSSLNIVCKAEFIIHTQLQLFS